MKKLILILILLASAINSRANTANSTNYSISQSSFSSGGAAASTNYSITAGNTEPIAGSASSSSYSIQHGFIIPQSGPDISVQYPSGTSLSDGSGTINIENPIVSETIDLTFTIQNVGNEDLTGLSVSIDGTNASEFTSAGFSETSLIPGAATSLTVTFTPTNATTRVAALHITSNDVNENPFDIFLESFEPFRVEFEFLIVQLVEGRSLLSVTCAVKSALGKK